MKKQAKKGCRRELQQPVGGELVAGIGLVFIRTRHFLCREREPRAAARCFGAMDGLFTFQRVFLRHTGSDLLSICEALRLLHEERRSISPS